MAKEDDGGREFEDDGELHNSAKKRSKVVWTSSLHTRFLLAVNHIGLDKAVPKTILQFMGVPGLTRENIASHLQDRATINPICYSLTIFEETLQIPTKVFRDLVILQHAITLELHQKLEVMVTIKFQQEDGVRELKFSSDNARYGDIEMNNIVTQLPQYPNFSNELSQHTKQTTNLEVNAYDQQEVGVTKIAFSSDTSHHGSIEMNNLVTQLPHPSLSDELSQHTEQTIDLEELLDASSQEKDEVTKSTFSSDSQYDDVIQMNNLGSQLSDPIFSNELWDHIEQTTSQEVLLDAPVEGANDGQTIELNSNDSFLAEIEAILDNKDWADQFIECLHENKDWTSF
ncbi:unnamed protein product [Linum tenue]|uniref:Uncharacterized protein n=1 Tax=Linum tenue TaxID=586396 RepID=A0AAV0QS91_9ROSI|nr:unnamed protein product [Linum tenue]